MGNQQSTSAVDAVPANDQKLSNKWYFPPDIAYDLDSVDLPPSVKAEVFACAWEYSRCIIPQFTNWNRYVAFMRTIVMGIVAEFRGDLVDVTAGDNILGYSLDGTLAELFEGTPGHEDMAREFKTFLLITSEKTSHRRDGELFRRYVNTLASSPKVWFRIRDCDALARFSIAAALACNDLDDVWYSDDELDILCEIGDTMYDAVAFYKHRSEGETNSTFAYVPEDARIQACHVARELLWALDVAMARCPQHAIAINFVRFFGGPLHMMMRRYRFVEDGLTIGNPESDAVVQQNRRNFKLWNRVDAKDVQVQGKQRYAELLTRSDELMFRGLGGLLESFGGGQCSTSSRQFGGVQLCDGCSTQWRDFVETLPERAKTVFPQIDLQPKEPSSIM
ncbi:hypothetical protein B0J13DRAFT_648154 [Dactylonectria estremocensis]|uniref:Uncharacterized protein n=1 Tax=Dactylonectria estremocensis TaxID=1079267 RepID=A0A9P9DM28_9HYPO|nr:hypothetical protein B0J13DRAFT_648154 [Dactylonectria estremocensis]